MIMSSNGDEMQYSDHEIAIDDFLDTSLLTNEDIAALLSSTNTMLMDSSQAALDRNSGLEKPVRKRSRASKHASSTFLVAKASDFRALVQQLTGCQSADSYKGPINLNFGAAEDEVTDDIDKVSTIPMLEFKFYNHKKNQQECQQQQHQHQLQHQQYYILEDDQRLHEEQESSSNGGNTFVSASSPGPYSLTRDDLEMDDIFMHDSFDYGEYSSNGIVADHVASGTDGDYSSDYGFADDTVLFSGY